MVKGRYEFALRNDEEVIWSKVEGDHVTRILIVGVFFLLIRNVLNILDSQSTYDETSVPLVGDLRAVTMAPSAVPSISHPDTQSFSPEVRKNPNLVLIANTLEVDPALTHRHDSSLRMWYKKYIAWNDAVAKLEELKSSNQWTLPETGQTELINIFSGQSYWHSHIKKAFKDIHNYKLMVEWLERDDDGDEPSDIHVWHSEKTHYTFKDLGIWKKEGTLDKDYQRRQKEKGKAKAKKSQRNEKRKKNESDDSDGEAETSKKKKKSSSGKTKSRK